MWAVEYKPETLKEFYGNDKAVSEVLEWVRNWKREKKKALMIIGPCGVGKTVLCELVAKKLSLNLVETNSSDVRSKKTLLGFFGKSLAQQSLFFNGKLVLFDELDGLSGMKDRGASSALKEIISNTKHPVILTATDKTVRSVKDLKTTCKVVNFDSISMVDLVKVLKRICSLAGIESDDSALKRVARSSGGDMRAAINNLQGIVSSDGFVSEQSAKEIDSRDSCSQISDILNVIFNTTDAGIADQVMHNPDASPDEIMEWIRENAPRVYKDKDDVARAMNMISRSDVFRGRISTQQYWRYLVYQGKLMSVGVATAKDSKYGGRMDPVFPQKIGILARTMFKRQKDKRNAKALGGMLHCSSRVARNYFPLIELMRNNRSAEYKKICDLSGAEF